MRVLSLLNLLFSGWTSTWVCGFVAIPRSAAIAALPQSGRRFSSSKPNDGDDDLLPTNMKFDAAAASAINPSNIKLRSSDGTETSLQTITYIASSLGYAVVSAIILFMPDKTNMARLDAKLGGAAGFAMAAAITNVLGRASSRNTLHLDAYKKLNLGLLAFGLIGVGAVPGESAFTPLQVPATLLAGTMSVLRILGALSSFFGWRHGIGQNKNIVAELAEGAQKTKASLDFEQKSKGYLYKWSTVVVGFGITNSLIMIARSKLEFDVSLYVSSISRLCLVASMLLTLKDANENDQLSSKTFFQMNYMLGMWMLLVGLGQGLSKSSFGFAFDFRKAKMVICSLPFFFKGIKGRKESFEAKTV